MGKQKLSTGDPCDPIVFTERLYDRSGGASLVHGNRVRYLQDSRENFPAWMDALAEAREFICIEMYIISADRFGKKIREMLLNRLADGVAVYFLYDLFGSLPAQLRRFFVPLRAAGAQVKAYNAPTLTGGIGMLSRNHRKSIIVDGKIAFVSGLCMSARWEGDTERGITPWRDSGLMIEGAAVAEILAAFKDSWTASGKTLPDNVCAASLAVGDDEVALRVVATTPRDANMIRLDLSAISMARETVWLTDAYFMPSRMYVQALINAAQDGVDVRILVPRTSDVRWIGMVSRTQYRALLEAGVRVFEWNGSMIHAKTAIVDGLWARVGSTNLNFSSWFANRELDIVLEGNQAVHELEKHFLWDLSQSTEVVLDENHEARLKEQRLHLKRKSRNRHTQAAARQIAYLTSAIDTVLRGDISMVDGQEMWAYVGICLSTLVLAVLIFCVPALVVFPAIGLLLVGVVVSALQVGRLYVRSRRKRPVARADSTVSDGASLKD